MVWSRRPIWHGSERRCNCRWRRAGNFGLGAEQFWHRWYWSSIGKASRRRKFCSYGWSAELGFRVLWPDTIGDAHANRNSNRDTKSNANTYGDSHSHSYGYIYAYADSDS